MAIKLDIHKTQEVDNFASITKIDLTQRIFLFGRTYEDKSQLNVFIDLQGKIYVYRFGTMRAFILKTEAKEFYIDAIAEKGNMKYDFITHNS